MCPYCKKIVNFEITKPQTIEFIPGYRFVVNYTELYKEKSFYAFVCSILKDFYDGKINLSDFKKFTDKGFYGEFQIEGKCPECQHEVTKVELVYYGAIAFVYEELLEELFLEAFKEKYYADGRFLIIRKDEIPNLSELLFHRDDKCSLRLYKLLDIYKYIPFERGGGGDEILEFAVKSVVVPLFVNFLYQIILQDKAEQFKKFIKQKHEDYKKNLDNKKILKQFEKYMKNENVEWNEDKAIELVKSGLDELTNKYIESLY